MTLIRRSLAYSVADSYVSLLLQLASTVIISRLLTPEQTGVFAVAAVFAALASTFRDFGVAEYLIQEKELDTSRIRAALAVNIAISWTMGAALFFGAPFAAGFYRNAGIGDVMRVQAFNFLLIPFGAVTMAYFRRELSFRPIFIASLLANITAFIVSVACAWHGFGYMSLAWSSLTGVAVTVAVSVWFRPAGFPRWPGLAGIGRVVHFGKHATGIYVFGQLGKGAPEMIIGRAENMVSVAFFSRANGLVEIFHRLVMRAVMPVCLPYFAQSKREPESLRRAYLTGVSYLTAIGWPFLLFMGIASYAAIRIVYGRQWMASVPLAQILCAAGSVELVYYLAKEVLLSVGEARQSNLLQMGIQGCLIAGLLVVVPFGLEGACWGVLAATIAGAWLSHRQLARAIGLTAAEVLKSCLPSLYLALLSAAPVALWAAVEPISESNHLYFGLGGGAMTAVAWLICLRLLGHPLWQEVLSLWRLLPLKRRGALPPTMHD